MQTRAVAGVPRYLPMALMGAVGFALAWLPGGTMDRGEYLVACGLGALASCARVAEARRGHSSRTWPSLLFLLAVGVLRDATGGGTGGLGALVLIPVVWIALYGTGRQLVAISCGVAATLVVPLLLIGAPQYPATGWRQVILLVSLSAIVGQAVQHLVRALRESAAQLTDRDRERDALLATLEALAATDTLTGIPNRRCWQQRLQEALADHTDSSAVCVAMLDMDHFKAINDLQGHEAGDAVLRECATAWLRGLRTGDTLARLGGDEFAVLLPHCDVLDAHRIVEQLRSATPPSVTISAGVVEHRPGETSSSLMARADRSLYAAKSAGRDQLVSG